MGWAEAGHNSLCQRETTSPTPKDTNVAARPQIADVKLSEETTQNVPNP